MPRDITERRAFGAWAEGVVLEEFAKSGVIEGVLLLKPESKNGYTYSPKAMASTARLSEGAKAYFDHPVDPRTGKPTSAPRGVRELIGTYTNARASQGEVRADLRVLNHQREIMASFLEQPEAIGNSLRGRGDFDKSGAVVEDIQAIVSHDFVTDPATTSGLYDSYHVEPEDSREENEMKTVAELKAEHPDLYNQVVAETRQVVEQEGNQAELKEQVAEKDKELKELREKNEKLELEKKVSERTALVETKIAKAKLPEYAVSKSFKERLIAADDEAAIDALIKEQSEIISKAKGATDGKPRSDERVEESEDGDKKPDKKSVLESLAPKNDNLIRDAEPATSKS